MANKPQSNTFSDVDQADNPQQFVTCLNEQYAKNSVLRLNKERTLEMADLQPGHKVLDVGCGTGVDAVQMAQQVGETGHVFGIDVSQTMVDAARRNTEELGLPITFQQSDIYTLDFADNFFDRCRADKTFQHLADPEAALQEVIRVTKPGGKIIIADPDHDSVVIDTPFADITNRFIRFRSEQMAQGGIAHQIYRMFKQHGFVDVSIDPRVQAYTNYEEKVASPYLKEIFIAQKHNVVTEAEAKKWAGYLQDAIENGRFLCLQTYIITIGTKLA